MKRQFPTSLDEYAALGDSPTFVHLNFATPETEMLLKHEQIFALINLAHECGIQSILPALYLETTKVTLVCSLFLPSGPVSVLADGRVQDNILFRSEDLRIPFTALRSCIYGRELLVQETTLRSYGTIASNFCETEAQCSSSLRRISQMRQMCPLEVNEALFTWPSVVNGWLTFANLVDELCEDCRKEVQCEHNTERERIWHTLPSYFKLPDWEDLEDYVT